ncbi:MFS transporter [Lentibacillus sediminis]|uniref:MFS transporter n=1 Tax=Lentibacillus sediminis TaxID=1940529 RepID=UPI0013040D7F|nr:MFS transporter [Lentibacillus sediminis]
MENHATENVSIWKNRTYLILFSSYAISTMGKYFDSLAVILLISYGWAAEPWMIALIPVAYALPHALFSQFAGVYIDRSKKVRLMLLADIMTALLTIVLLFTSNLWVMLGIILARSSFTVVHFPAQQALVKQVVHPDLILKAVTLNGTVNQLSKIIGPFLGASIAAAFSPKVSFVVYIAALVISVCILLFIRHVDTDESAAALAVGQSGNSSFWKTWGDGWRTMFRSKVLIASFSFVLVAFLVIQLVDAQFAVLFRQLYPDNPSVLGWFMSAVGFGSVVIILYLSRLKKIKNYGWYLGSSGILIGGGFLAVGMFPPEVNILWTLAAALLIGIGVGIFSTVFSYILQMESPDGKVGQMSGMYNSLTGIVLLLAPIVGGFLVQWFGVLIIFQMIGMATLAIGFLGVVMQKVLWGSDEEVCEGKGEQEVV